MKLVMLTALAALATPALAQTTPPPADPPMSQPAPTPPATPPAPADPAMAQPMATPAAPTPADGAYPKCSRTVTDHCTENSNARGERLHSTPRPKR